MTETLMNETILECPDFNEETNELLKNVSFWVEGFLSCVFAIIGILGNVGSAIVLSGKGKSKMEEKIFKLDILFQSSSSLQCSEKFICPLFLGSRPFNQ